MRVLNLATLLDLQAPRLLSKFRDRDILTISPFEQKSGKNIKCEMGSLSYVFALIYIQIWGEIDGIDEGELSGESNINEGDILEILDFLRYCDLVVVSDENFTQNGEELRAILGKLSKEFGFKIVNLDNKEIKFEYHLDFSRFKQMKNYDGIALFHHNLNDDFLGGEYFMMSAKIKNGDEVFVEFDNFKLKKIFKFDPNLRGSIGILGDVALKNSDFKVVKISKV